jgi:hypothetical protein
MKWLGAEQRGDLQLYAVLVFLLLGALLVGCGDRLSASPNEQPLVEGELSAEEQVVGPAVAKISKASQGLSVTSTEDGTVTSLLSKQELLELFEEQVQEQVTLRFGGQVRLELLEDNLVIYRDGDVLGRLDEVKVEGVGDQFYLISRGELANGEGDCLSFAAPLAPIEDASLSSLAADDDTIYALEPNAVKHSCTGKGCSSCSFVRDRWTNRIKGCKCNSFTIFGRCDHSVSQ